MPDMCFIPEDLDGCISELLRTVGSDEIEKFKNGAEKDTVIYHFGTGMAMRNNWGLWAGSRLAKWFNSIGINHPYDMSGIIMTSLWRHLNGQSLGLDEQVKYYQEYWEKYKKTGEIKMEVPEQ